MLTMKQKLLLVFVSVGFAAHVFAANPPPYPKPPQPSGTPKPLKCIDVNKRVGLCGDAKPFKRFTVGIQIRFDKQKINRLRRR